MKSSMLDMLWQAFLKVSGGLFLVGEDLMERNKLFIGAIKAEIGDPRGVDAGVGADLVGKAASFKAHLHQLPPRPDGFWRLFRLLSF